MKYLPSTLSVAAACLLSISLSAQTKPVDLYVGVVDAKGEPASGLQAADFQVREDGTAREVLKAGEATEPLTVALLVDDSQAMSPAMKLSGAAAVRIEARVSRSGNAMPQAGDIVGTSGVVKPGTRDVKIVLDKVVP